MSARHRVQVANTLVANRARLGKRGNGQLVGCISSSLFLYTKQLLALREHWISERSLFYLIELGQGVLDGATVETALTISGDYPVASTLFIDLTEEEDKATSIDELVLIRGRTTVQALAGFQKLDTSPFCYHVPAFELTLWNNPDRIDPTLGSVVAGNLAALRKGTR